MFELAVQTFETRLPELLRDHRGQFALVHGTDVVGFFPTEDAAIAAGYKRFSGDEAFLAQLVENEPAAVFASNRIRPPSGP
jgi:hypothetical protein